MGQPPKSETMHHNYEKCSFRSAVLLLIIAGMSGTAVPAVSAEATKPLVLPVDEAAPEDDGAAAPDVLPPNQTEQAQPAGPETVPFDWRDDLYGPMVVDAAAGAPPAVAAESCCLGQPCQNHCRRCAAEGCQPAFYLAGIIGPSFGTLTNETLPTVSESLFTAGGAIGVDLNPAAAGWRFDFEARYRDPLGNTAALGGLPVAVRAEQLWSTLVNAYRDIELTDRLDLYLNAGIGAGGYQTSYTGSDAIFNVEVAGNRGLTSFAWQAGTGLAWEITPRLTFDIGYRFFEVAGGTTTVTATQSGTVLSTTDIASAFSASEVLFSLRIAEPFRRWR